MRAVTKENTMRSVHSYFNQHIKKRI